ncbi:MAG: type I-C CRISPR-associated endonuclease Cas1c [Oscillospiraceae bacterium]|jgi:CRISPR-associated protein Cas1|nr:type I-C CRISPR-associated endonuclease Cas1c [Oscillospiraceae bacterium]
MKKLLNILYVTYPDAFLALEGETVVVRREEEKPAHIPLLNLEGIVTFGYTGASPALMGACAERGISLNFMTPNGKFLAEICGNPQGNVVLRRTQYRWADDEAKSAAIAKNILTGKLHNSRWVLDRAVRDHEARIDVAQVRTAARYIAEALAPLREAETLGTLRGVEGEAAMRYFDVFDELILQSKDDFKFSDRNRRPPTDKVNALLSFAYTMLANECASALRSVGLDPYVGFLHRDRPGRKSLALDLMEEFRAVFADRFVLTLINTRQVEASDFHVQENGAVKLKDDARRSFLTAWQNRKKDEIQHPFLHEKIDWGLVPYAQALLLARYMRGDLEEYPPFLWK